MSILVQPNQELKVHTNTLAKINPDTAQSVFSGTDPADKTRSRTQGSHKYCSQYQSGYISVCIDACSLLLWLTRQKSYLFLFIYLFIILFLILYFQCQSRHDFICIDSQSSSIFQESDSRHFLFANQEEFFSHRNQSRVYSNWSVFGYLCYRFSQFRYLQDLRRYI